MTANGENLRIEVESRVEALLSALEDSRKESETLKADVKRLKDELREAHAEIVGLQRKYDNLQLAKANISLSKGDVQAAKKRMSEIIRQIDYCIAKLSE